MYVVFVVVAAWTGLEQVGSVLVDACDQETHAIGAFGGFLGLVL